jgi:hypothetical protein
MAAEHGPVASVSIAFLVPVRAAQFKKQGRFGLVTGFNCLPRSGPSSTVHNLKPPDHPDAFQLPSSFRSEQHLRPAGKGGPADSIRVSIAFLVPVRAAQYVHEKKPPDHPEFQLPSSFRSEQHIPYVVTESVIVCFNCLPRSGPSSTVKDCHFAFLGLEFQLPSSFRSEQHIAVLVVGWYLFIFVSIAFLVPVRAAQLSIQGLAALSRVWRMALRLLSSLFLGPYSRNGKSSQMAATGEVQIVLTEDAAAANLLIFFTDGDRLMFASGSAAEA